MILLMGMFSRRMALTLALTFVLGAFGAGVAYAQEVKIAAVNSDRVLRESAPAKAAEVKLDAEFAPRDKELQDMGKRLKSMSDAFKRDSASMPEDERAQKQHDLEQLANDFQRKQLEFRADLTQRRNEELASILDQANKVIRQIAEQQHYDLIVQEAVYISPRIDITDQVIRALATGSTAHQANQAANTGQVIKALGSGKAASQ